MYSEKYKYILIPNMRTGTQSMTKALKPFSNTNDDKHYKAYELMTNNFVTKSSINYSNKNKKMFEEISKNWDSYFKFSFVRNPWDHFLSIYEYTKKYKNTNLSFNDFVIEQYNNNYSCLYDWNFINLYDRISDPKGKIIVDFVGRFENINTDWKFVCNKIGIDVSLPKINQTNRDIDYRKYYTESTKELIGKMYEVDIINFNYKF